MTSTRLPTLFIPHGGGPCFFMDWTMGPPDTWNRMAEFLKGVAATLPERPKAIVVISGHWETPDFAVNAGANPPLLYDYNGFPEHTYKLTYPAPGAPELAETIRKLLANAGFKTSRDTERGFDHGVFIPFKLIYPDADIPIVQLSLKAGLDPASHLRAGQALSPLRDQGVLIVGSGMSYHNLRAFGASGAEASEAFDTWLTDTVETSDPDARNAALGHWADAPAARIAHPREEHLLPLMVAAGAAGADQGRKVFEDRIPSVKVSAYQFG